MSLLITLEGIEGSGKTTLINNLKKSGELEINIYSWRDTDLGKKVWNLINEKQTREKVNLLENWTNIFLFLSAFNELDKKIIRPNLQKKKVVVLDSYIDSAFVYRGLEKRIEIDLIRSFVEKTSDLLFPDITFLLDIDPQKAQKRLKERKLNADDCENRDDSNLEFHHKIRNHYLELKNLFPERIYIINAERSENEILEEVKTIIKKCFPDKESEKTLPNLVRVMIKNEKGELLLVKDKKWGWNLPGGKIELNETPETAACREVFEETNLIIENPQKIGEEVTFFANLSPGQQHWMGHFFQTDNYSGEIKNKGDVTDINFFDIDSKIPEGKNSSYQFYLEKIKKSKYSQ